MDVKCPNCATLYDFDDSRISGAGVMVKCTQCGHEFMVRKQDALPKAGSSKDEWKVRTITGNEFSFRDLTTLQRWIVEGKVGRDDQISKTGEVWRRLGDIIELQAFFAVVEKAQAPAAGAARPGPTQPGTQGSYPTSDPAWAAGARPPEPATTEQKPVEQAAVVPDPAQQPAEVPAPADVQPVQQPQQAQPGPAALESPAPASPGPAAVEPAIQQVRPDQADTQPKQAEQHPAAQGAREGQDLAAASQPGLGDGGPRDRLDTGEWMAKEPVEEDYDDFSDLDTEHVPLSRGKVIAGSAIALVCVVALAFVIAPDVMKSLFGLGGPGSEAKAAFDKGLEALYKDCTSGFDEARNQFKEAHAKAPEWADSLAAMGMADTAEAEQLNDMAEPIKAELHELKKEIASLPGDDKKAKAELAAKYNVLVAKYKSLQDKIGPAHGDAWKNIEKAQKLDPESPWSRLALADFYRVFGGDKKRKDVADLVGSVLKAEPKNPLALFERGAFRAADPGQLDKGIKDLDDAYAANPSMVRALYRSAMALLAAGKVKEAVARLEQVLKAQPEHEAAKAALKRARTAAGRAVKEKQVASKQEQKSGERPVRKTEEEKEKEKKRPAEAEKQKEGGQPRKQVARSVQRVPKSSGVNARFARMLAQGNRFRARGKYEKALEIFEKAADLKPEAPEPHAGMGWAYIDLEAYRAAESEFKKALKVSPRHAEAVLGLAEAYKFQGNKAKAVEYYKRYLKLVPTGEGATIARKYIQDNQ